MGTRATRTLASLALRCFRGQKIHSALGEQPPVPSGSLAALSSSSSVTSSSVEGRVDGGQRVPWQFETMLLDPEPSTFECSQKLPMNDYPVGRLLQNKSPTQDGSTDEWSKGTLNGRLFRGVQHCTSETITEGHGEEAAFGRDLDFFSRYLQWSSYDRSVLSQGSQNYPAAAAAVSALDVDGLISPTRHNCKSNSIPCLPLSSLSLNFKEEPSMIIPLEADSVKRKRKKKMNKHKQRKLRRRDRHRN